MQFKISYWLALGGLLPLLLHASVVPRENSEKTTTDILVADDILIAGMVFLVAGAVTAMIVKHIADHTREDRVSLEREYLQAQSGPRAAIAQVLDNVHNQDQSVVLLAVRAFVLVTGFETLGVPGQDWGAIWIPVQISSTTASPYVVWWSKKRGGALVVHNPRNQDDSAISKGGRVMGQAFNPSFQVFL
ncbi:hypothetical protein EYR40_010628 [Pleurotus pulmonarius]|nr:hypothetical protein EYR40_010628 [Pleurotus pulmonarius]